MKAPRSRRRPWPHFRDALLGVYAACLMCACTDGVGMPLKLADGGPELTGHAGSAATRGDGGPDHDYDTDETAPLNAKCRDLDAKWLSDAEADEQELVDQMNLYREMSSGLCGPGLPPAPPLRSNATLQCVARLRAKSEVVRNQSVQGMPAGYTAATPVFSRLWSGFPSQNGVDWRDQKKVAGLDERSAVSSFAEVVISGASSVEAIVTASKSDPEPLCSVLFGTGATLIGAGRSGNVWVLDFGGPRSPYSPRPGTGGR